MKRRERRQQERAAAKAAVPGPAPAGTYEVVAPLRLAIRTEDEWVVAYLAPRDTMDGAKKVAVIHRRVLEESPGAFEQWKTLLGEWMRTVSAEAAGLPLEAVVARDEIPRSDA